MALKTIVIPSSKNVKTGNIIQSYSSRSTCPDTCIFKHNGCYADGHRTAMQWKRADDPKDKRFVDNETDLTLTLLAAVAQHAKEDNTVLFRHNIAGDMAKANSGDLDGETVDTLINASQAVSLFAKNTLKVRFYAYTYTHCKQTPKNDQIIQNAISKGFVINYSCETVSEVIKAHSKGIPTAITSLDPEKTIEQLKEHGIHAVQCPSQTKGISCKRCKLCAMKAHNPVIFAVHGNSAKKAQQAIKFKVVNE